MICIFSRGRPRAVRDVFDARELDRCVGGVRLQTEGHQRRLRRAVQGAGQCLKGPSIYDVRIILGFFDPLPPLSAFGTDLQY